MSKKASAKHTDSQSHSHGNHHDHGHGHSHSEESRRKLINRLSRIEGHVRGVKTMITEDRACPEVLIQLAAIRGAIDRVSRAILDDHMSECLTRAAHEGNIEAEIDGLKQALDRFLPG
ncbi:MAG: metal-sensing transcriptional repressor [Cyanobacteria bacterium P01_F01_bin.153]